MVETSGPVNFSLRALSEVSRRSFCTLSDRMYVEYQLGDAPMNSERGSRPKEKNTRSTQKAMVVADRLAG